MAFRGLPRDRAFTINFYSHFRNVQSDDKKTKMLEADAVFQPDFLDEVACDMPMGCWSI